MWFHWNVVMLLLGCFNNETFEGQIIKLKMELKDKFKFFQLYIKKKQGIQYKNDKLWWISTLLLYYWSMWACENCFKKKNLSLKSLENHTQVFPLSCENHKEITVFKSTTESSWVLIKFKELLVLESLDLLLDNNPVIICTSSSRSYFMMYNLSLV